VGGGLGRRGWTLCGSNVNCGGVGSGRFGSTICG